MLLKLTAVMRETALSRSSIYNAIQEGRFPRPVKIGKRAVAWRAEDIAAWRAGLPETAAMPSRDRPLSPQR
jgi:prophage regulatory protein